MSPLPAQDTDKRCLSRQHGTMTRDAPLAVSQQLCTIWQRPPAHRLTVLAHQELSAHTNKCTNVDQDESQGRLSFHPSTKSIKASPPALPCDLPSGMVNASFICYHYELTIQKWCIVHSRHLALIASFFYIFFCITMGWLLSLLVLTF